jgi:hypothetical protein
MAIQVATGKNPGNTERRALDRREFLKLGATSVAFSPAVAAPMLISGATHSTALPALGGGPLPAVPAPADLASDKLVHHFRDLFNPPLAHNEWGCLQAAKSVSGITAIYFPPFACCGTPEMPFSPGNLMTCEIFMNGQVLTSFPPPAGEVAYTWYPHRIVRETVVEGIRFTTETFTPSKQRCVAELITVRNESRERRTISLGFDLRAGVTVKPRKSWSSDASAEPDNKLTADGSRGCLIFEAQHTRAVSVQGISPRPARIERGRMLVHEISLDPGEARTFHYLNVIGEGAEAALDLYDRQQANFKQLRKDNEEHCASLLRSAFTPGNSEFSGHLPQLITNNHELWKLYHTGFTNLLVNRRISPDSVYGPAYTTIPHFCPTWSFIWDAMLTSLSLSLLDPQVLRGMLENWLAQDMHQHLATDYLIGKGVGPWYAVNDMGILRCAHDYLRVTGDQAWLDKTIEGKPAIEHLVDHALYWKTLDKLGHGLADYGKLDDLLEVVSTWLHEVAAMNAGNVYGMRFVASLLERRGDAARAAQLRSEAQGLAARINGRLYVEGKGWWKAGQPDGTFNEVRHCYDLLTVLDTMVENLSEKQKREMSAFFWSELHTPLWMHALSPGDVDATWNLRADHSWLGAYTAWPSMTAKGLYKIDQPSRVASWVKGLAKSANQGPFGQAHIVESIFPAENGGAFKCPLDQPYGNDWCCVSGGSFTDLVIDTIFGADLTLYDGIGVNSHLADFDPAARLVNVSYQRKKFNVTLDGAESA